MPVIEIRRNADGTVRHFYDKWEWSEYQWTDGNYGCDCNRALFFGRAAGGEGDECDCGMGTYSIRVQDYSGDLLYQDEGW